MARWTTALGLVAWIMAAGATAAEQATPAADVPPPRMTAVEALAAVDRALVRVDLPLLLDIYPHNPDPIAHVLAATALERVQFHLEKAIEDARLCEKELIDPRPGIALYCARLANGALRLAQGDKPAEADELDIARRFAGHAPAAPLSGRRV